MRRPFRLVLAAALGAAAAPLAAQAPAATPAARADTAPPAQLASATPVIPAGGIEIDRVIAVVGSSPILYSELTEEMLLRRARGVTIPEDSTQRAKLERDVLNEMIDAELLVKKARDEKVEVDEDQLNKQVDDQLKQIRGRFASETEFRNELRRSGLGTPDEYRRKQLEMLRRNEMQREVFQKLRRDQKLAQSPVSDQELEEAYQQSKATLPKREATIGFRQIVVAPKPAPTARQAARAKAESLLVELNKGGDFELVARRESMDPGSKERGGDLGWNRRGKMVKEFDDVMFAMPVGRLSPVIETPFGFHIIRVDRAQPSEVKARHILIRPRLDSADVRRAREEADSVLAVVRRGANFDSLSLKHHDPVENGNLPEFPRKDLPSSYAAAMGGEVTVGTLVGPFAIEDPVSGLNKFVVLRVTNATAAGEYPVAEVKERLREQVSEGKTIRKLIDSLRKANFVDVRI
jgi:peptidyl-prolyl cis-trans isomerase SurA